MTKRSKSSSQPGTVIPRDKRGEILHAALEAFIREGFAQTSMDRIAELAPASKRTVYNYFPTKEALFLAVLQRVMADAFDLQQVRYDSTHRLDEQLEQFIHGKIAFVQNPASAGIVKVVAGMLISHPQLVKQVIQRSQGQEDPLARWLTAAVEDGTLRVPDVALAAEAFWAMVDGAFFWPTVFDGPLDPHDAEVLRKELVLMFLARYSPASLT